jgi:uncharacterized protein YcaQ
MVDMLQLTNQEARRFLLAKHGLWPPRGLRGKAGVRAVFDRLASIQFDPIDVVGRNPDLVLQSRVVDYEPAMLHELAYEERHLYDYWDKMMSLLPVVDWPNMALHRERWRQRHATRRAKMNDHVETVLGAIRDEGPMSSIDFQPHHGVDHKVDWRWGPMRAVKAILEMLMDSGDLMVSYRQANRRFYDLAERVLPPDVAAATPMTDEETYLRWRVARRCRGIGLLGPGLEGEVWYGCGKAVQRNPAIQDMVDAGEMVPVQVEGDPRTYHMVATDLPHLERAQTASPAAEVAFIAPLDNLMWSRNLVERLFDFRYIWEVYKPVAERRYGYYVLPVLFGDRLVARFEPKLDREGATLTLLNWYWEPGAGPSEPFAAALEEALRRFRDYLSAEQVVVAEGVDAEVARVAEGMVLR